MRLSLTRSATPLPWCTSQSSIATRSTPLSGSSSARTAATVQKLKRQKPMPRSARRGDLEDEQAKAGRPEAIV